MRVLSLAAALLVASSVTAEVRFSAADVPKARIKQSGRVVVQNQGRTITAYHFFGDIRQALMSLTSASTLHFNPFGPAVYQSDARLTAVMPPYLSAAIIDAARQHGVDPRLLAAVAARESNYNPLARSAVGASGIMQLMPETARYLGVANPLDARESVFGGARYLRKLLDSYRGDLDLTLAAYNAGPGAVQRYSGVPPFRETQAYVKSIRAAYERAVRGQ